MVDRHNTQLGGGEGGLKKNLPTKNSALITNNAHVHSQDYNKTAVGERVDEIFVEFTKDGGIHGDCTAGISASLLEDNKTPANVFIVPNLRREEYHRLFFYYFRGIKNALNNRSSYSAVNRESEAKPPLSHHLTNQNSNQQQ